MIHVSLFHIIQFVCWLDVSEERNFTFNMIKKYIHSLFQSHLLAKLKSFYTKPVLFELRKLLFSFIQDGKRYILSRCIFVAL